MSFINLEYHGVHTMEPEGFSCAVFRWDEGNRILPIWISQDDADLIQAQDAGYSPRRPGPHDLLADTLTRFTPGVVSLKIVSHFEGVFMAAIVTPEGEEVDARPCDVILLSRIMEIPIAVDEEVLQQTSIFITDEDLEAYFGITVDRAPTSTFDAPESASGDAQADADFEQLMQSLGVSESDLLSSPDTSEEEDSPDIDDDGDGN
ncbi:bifunctional nuclease family protein [Corynebacterium pacaense]|uniref:bifunctional nuclease family protein n=1 Tax=Corynebacterium pacaense TaxID=1816684 RepID=UPI0009BB8EB8|nr:bifunctional nuclease domain-containing protein [Corynebacterium pacaense]